MTYEVGLIQDARGGTQADVVVADSIVAALLAPRSVLSSAVLAGLP